MIDSILSFDNDAHLKCEYLVVGSGASGALTASFLAKSGGDVLIVEEGPYVRPTLESSSINASFPKVWRNGGVTPILGKTNFAFAEGCCVGGSTMVNSALIHRIPAEIMREWSEKFHIVDFEVEMINKYHEIIERELHVQVINNNRNIANTLFKQGAEKCGFKGMDVPMAADYKDGRLSKMDMQKTFLKKAVQSGAKIIADCKVNKMDLQDSEAKRVTALHTDNKRNKIQLTIEFKKIYLCAGAIQTPLLLRRSGIKKNVGDNIQFHPTFRTVAEFDMPLDTHTVEMPSYQVKEFSPDISMGASVGSPAYTAAGLSVNWESNKQNMKFFRNMATFYVMTRCSSRGRVRNFSFQKDSYFVQYRIDRVELRNLSFGFAKLAELLFAAGAKRLYPSIDGHEPIEDRKYSDYYLNNDIPATKAHLMTIHSFSSCPMGENTDLCAVDSHGKLHGFRNIYINDASILPNSPGVNPQGPLMAVALRNMEMNFN